MSTSKTNVAIAAFVAFGMVLSIIEWLIPIHLVVPGVKLGLANIAILLATAYFTTRQVLTIAFIRSLLTVMISANIVSFLFSLVGGLLSASVMCLMLKKGQKLFSIKGASIAGAFLHNVGQMSVAIFFVGDTSVLLLLPLLGTSSIITGFITGWVAENLRMKVQKEAQHLWLEQEQN